MKSAEIKDLSVKELQERIDVEKAQLSKLKLQHELAVDRMLYLTGHCNHDGFLHFVADNHPNTLFSKISFHNGN